MVPVDVRPVVMLSTEHSSQYHSRSYVLLGL
jgi:hypothetical protein